MKAIKLPLAVEEGAIFNEKFIMMTQDHQRRDLTNHLVRMTIRPSPTSATLLTQVFEEMNQIHQGGAAQDWTLGQIELLVPATVTVDWNFNSGWYNIELVPYVRGTVITTVADADMATVDIDVTGAGSGYATMTANAGTPWAALSAADLVLVEDSENLNDGVYTVRSVVGAVLTFESEMRGTDNSDDETLSVYPLTLTTTSVERILEGSVVNSRETVRA